MEFEEMQVIWNEQNNEKLFAINEAALHKRIQEKEQSVEHLLRFIEWAMVAANLIVAVVLLVDAIVEGEAAYQYFIAIAYIAYSLYAIFRRLRRRQAEVPFEQTILGELDKAIWRLEYLIQQSKTIIYWYVLPLSLIVAGSFLLKNEWIWALAFLLVLVPASILGPRWEANRWYVPKKRELEKLREMLLAEVE